MIWGGFGRATGKIGTRQKPTTLQGSVCQGLPKQVSIITGMRQHSYQCVSTFALPIHQLSKYKTIIS